MVKNIIKAGVILVSGITVGALAGVTTYKKLAPKKETVIKDIPKDDVLDEFEEE